MTATHSYSCGMSSEANRRAATTKWTFRARSESKRNTIRLFPSSRGQAVEDDRAEGFVSRAQGPSVHIAWNGNLRQDRTLLMRKMCASAARTTGDASVVAGLSSFRRFQDATDPKRLDPAHASPLAEAISDDGLMRL